MRLQQGRSAADRCSVIGGQLAVREKADQAGQRKTLSFIIQCSPSRLAATPSSRPRPKKQKFLQRGVFFLTEARERLALLVGFFSFLFSHVKNVMKTSGAAQLWAGRHVINATGNKWCGLLCSCRLLDANCGEQLEECGDHKHRDETRGNYPRRASWFDPAMKVFFHASHRVIRTDFQFGRRS